MVPKVDVVPKRDCCGLAAKMLPWFPLTDVELPNIETVGLAAPNKFDAVVLDAASTLLEALIDATLENIDGAVVLGVSGNG